MKGPNCLVQLFLVFIGCHICQAHTIVKLKQGVVEGTLKKSYDGKSYSAFEGIPYAKPPIGNLRFKEPVPASNWENVLKADKTYICSQLAEGSTVIGTEDCLYMNVYVAGEKIDRSNNLDVVVHIHGGPWLGLIRGSPHDMAQPDYLMNKNLIMVTFNYRIGAPGFLSTGDEVVPGNNGFKDQTIALKWIKNNIRQFGGSPDSITLTGFSYGGASVQFHYISPLSKGLFHRGFAISGVVTNPQGLTLNPLQKAKQLAQGLECPVDNSRKMVDCLKKVPIEHLVNSTIWFKPAVEKGNPSAFLPEHPYKLLKDKKVYDVPFIQSNVIDEDMFSLGAVHNNRSQIFSICNHWTEWGTSWLDLGDYVDKDKLEDTLSKLKKFYLDDCKKITEENGLEKLNKIMNDRHFFVGADLSLRTQAAATKSSVFYYISKYIPKDHLQLKGPAVASHGVDNKLIFKFSTNPDKLKMKDEDMMHSLIDFLANYAKTGIPWYGNVKWQPINPDQETLNVLEIISPDVSKMTTVKELAPRQFWDSLPIKENNHLD